MKRAFWYGVIITAILGFIVIWHKRDAEYNKYMCAVYGYEADCKTPLPADRRLK